MTGAIGKQHGLESQTPMKATLWSMFCVAAVGTTLLWVPLTALPILDGLLFVAPLHEVMRDLGLLGWLGLLPAAALAILSRAIAGLIRLAGVSATKAVLTGWAVLLLPLIWVVGWHGARTLWHWTRTVVGVDFFITPSIKVIALLGLLGVMAWTVRRLSLTDATRRLVTAMLAARGLAFGLLAAALGALLVYPPTSLPVPPKPDATLRAAPAPSVYLIVLDTLTAADADACNPNSATMPRLASLAARSSCFTRFYAASNFTTATTSTMDSGLLPWTHLATQPDATMAQATRGHTLAAVLQSQAWRTHAVTDNMLASPRHRRTFAAYTSSPITGTSLVGNEVRRVLSVFPDTALPRLAATALAFMSGFDVVRLMDRNPFDSQGTYAAVLSLLKREDRSIPLFVWTQLFPPHAPYLPPPSTKYRLLPKGQLDNWRDLMMDNTDYAPSDQVRIDQHRLRYRESVMGADESLGAFLDELDRKGLLESALVVVTSDHGESFDKGY